MPDNFDRFCALKRFKLRDDEDWVSIYDGREGSGKSTGAIWDGFATSRKLFDVEAHVCYDPEEFMRLVDDVPRWGTLVLDEAGEAFFSRSFRENMNMAIAKTLQQMRYRNLNVIFCVPHKDYIDLIGRVRARSWTHLSARNRGKAEVMIPFRGKYYSRDEPFWKTQFFYQFNRLPDPVYERYLKVKIAKSKERLARYIDEIERKRSKYEDDKPSLENVIKKIENFEDKNQIKNSRGAYDRDLIVYEFGIPQNLARAACIRLNSS